MALASVCQIARDLTGVEPFEVHLARRAPIDPTVYARHFRRRCGLSPKDPRWFTPAPTWRLRFPARTRNCAPQRNGGSSNLPTPRRRAFVPTRRAIVPLLQSKTLSLSGVAEKLSMQPRTLNRRLAPEGASFQGKSNDCDLKSRGNCSPIPTCRSRRSPTRWAIRPSAPSRVPSAAGREQPPANGGKSFKDPLTGHVAFMTPGKSIGKSNCRCGAG